MCETKVCRKCSKEKDRSDFYREARNSDGLRSYCKECVLQSQSTYRRGAKEKISESNRLYRVFNKEALSLKASKYYLANKAKYREAASKRRASLRQAKIPLTQAQKEELSYLYWLAEDLRKVSPDDYHVDHIVPLTNPSVCGLHWPLNLQVLPKDLNLAKSNNFPATRL